MREVYPATGRRSPAPAYHRPMTNTRVRFRWAWWLLAWASLGLAMLGVILPGLPTVPFILLAAWAAARGSRKLHARLLADPRFGPMIRDWEAHGAVSRRAKRLAVAMMALSGVLLALLARPLVALVACACMAGVATWLWMRPEPPEPPH